MNLFYDLPEELKEHVYKMQMKYNVLPEFMAKLKTFSVCKMCCIHGIPCMWCAIVRFEGEHGAGYHCGDRVIPMRARTPVCDRMLDLMVDYTSDVHVVYDLYELDQRPQNQCFIALQQPPLQYYIEI